MRWQRTAEQLREAVNFIQTPTNAKGSQQLARALSIRKNGVTELTKSSELAGISGSPGDVRYEVDPRS